MTRLRLQLCLRLPLDSRVGWPSVFAIVISIPIHLIEKNRI